MSISSSRRPFKLIAASVSVALALGVVVPASAVSPLAATATAAEANSATLKAVKVPDQLVNVVNPFNLTEAEKQAVKDAIVAANPGLDPSVITVESYGGASIGENSVYTEITLGSELLVREKQVEIKDVVAPAPVVVVDPSHLTEEEQDAVVEAILAANPGLERSYVLAFEDGTAMVNSGGDFNERYFDEPLVKAGAAPTPVDEDKDANKKDVDKDKAADKKDADKDKAADKKDADKDKDANKKDVDKDKAADKKDADKDKDADQGKGVAVDKTQPKKKSEQPKGNLSSNPVVPAIAGIAALATLGALASGYAPVLATGSAVPQQPKLVPLPQPLVPLQGISSMGGSNALGAIIAAVIAISAVGLFAHFNDNK